MFLQPEDRAILALECPTVVGHTCKVARLALRVEPDRIRARVAERLSAVPVLTRRLGGDPDAPEWVEDAAFDLTHHVRPAPVEGPLDEQGLRNALAGAFAEHLDRDRPLWRIDVASLADGGTALIWRVHHALADGTTLVRWAEALLWDAVDIPPAPLPAPASAVGTAEERRRRRALAGFLGREHAVSAHRSPFDGVIGTRREVGTAVLSLDSLRTAARTLAGATVNDALLAVLTGALRDYLQTHVGRVTDVRVRIPVSLHHDGDDVANRDAWFTLALPLHLADPVERLHVITRATAVRKQRHDAEVEDAVLHAASGSAALARMLSRANDNPRSFAVSVSNVPGPRHPVAVCGAEVTGLIGLAEIGRRHGLRVAAVSLGDAFSLGFCADPDLVPGVQTLAEAALLDAQRLAAAAG